MFLPKPFRCCLDSRSCTSWTSRGATSRAFITAWHRCSPDFSGGTTTSRTNVRHPSPITNSATSSAYFDKLNTVDATIKSSLTVVRVPLRGWKNSRPLLRTTRRFGREQGGAHISCQNCHHRQHVVLINKKCGGGVRAGRHWRKRSTERCYYSTTPGNHLDCSP